LGPAWRTFKERYYLREDRAQNDIEIAELKARIAQMKEQTRMNEERVKDIRKCQAHVLDLLSLTLRDLHALELRLEASKELLAQETTRIARLKEEIARRERTG
jgi:chromosome segregation ATPase